jgi:hypothetical protein
MIEGFSEITAELTAEEKELIPILVKGFNAHKGKENAIKGPVIVSKINWYIFNNDATAVHLPPKITEARLRKLANFIRRHGIIPLIATSNGYYVSNDREEILNQMKSLQQRAEAILAAKNGLEKFITEV